jgi:hypothetical protein
MVVNDHIRFSQQLDSAQSQKLRVTRSRTHQIDAPWHSIDGMRIGIRHQTLTTARWSRDGIIKPCLILAK